jgi:hypothetical protein
VWQVRVETRTRLSAGPEDFWLEADIVAMEGEDEVFWQQRRERVPRDGL